MGKSPVRPCGGGRTRFSCDTEKSQRFWAPESYSGLKRMPCGWGEKRPVHTEAGGLAEAGTVTHMRGEGSGGQWEVVTTSRF